MTENTAKVADHQTRKKAHRYFFAKVLVNVFLIVLGAVLIAIFLRQMQAQSAIAKQEENSRLALEEAVETLEENAENAEMLTKIYHYGNQEVLTDLLQLFDSGLFDSLKDADNETRSEVFADLIERSGVQYLFLLSPDGRIVLSAYPELYNKNPAAYALMTQENVNQILKGTVRKDGSVYPVTVGSQYGTHYYYSVPYEYNGATYMLVLGADATVLDVQIASLKDVSVVLSRAAIGNDGFMFAVDSQDGTFLYYRNGDEILTGQSAFSSGLSTNALQDGYSGTETIKGVKYYCVSKTMGNKTVICAVADTAKILKSDRYVLFWTILGFVLVMLLCLSYAVIVRNDFVRHAVETDRVVLRKTPGNQTFFDKSIFRKIFPLMIASVLVMYGISFYTQTLLEITEGVERSIVALDEVSGRYDESTISRETIQNYYNNRFLSKARLIAFLIEEDPSVLNEDSDLHHSFYDKDGNKVFLKDDEGNLLKSVSESADLQKMCDANEIDSIYVFDEDGHTIATNTSNWFFTISQNEGDQSYPFLQVLDGRIDSLVQEAQVNDLGENNQYIGVAFHYYTAENEDGDTVYVSRFTYDRFLHEAQTEEEREAIRSEITEHRSMIQIGLDQEISGKLLESTDVANILSTNMLSGGFLVMFDASEDHLCVYSPKESSVGKPAAELGISPNAFGENAYYGFTRVNGTDYFQYFRYASGYYIATALPRASMFLSRGIISLLTALTCLILILILSATVTCTTEEEERLYATMSAEQAEKGLNSAIFNVILPSGRSTSTVKAAARWDNRRIPWGERGPEQKLAVIVSGVVGILIVYVIVSVIGADTIFDQYSVIHYIIDGGWDRGRNIFALSSCAITLLTVIIGIYLFRVPVRLVTSILGARAETVGHLLLSVVKYGGVLGALFYCLYLLGFDSSSLLASAGILSLVIGLGAQSLIKDILAGIFIVFEGEFRVGDIVTISDYRGTVMDIGLRTTKILGADGNIKIYNNSEISGVLNMTQEASVAVCKISIEYGQDIEYVEAVLNRELPKLRDDNPKILTGPDYLGVATLGESGVDLLIICKCSEQDVRGMNRYLNREVLKIFYRNHINVPFPNVTVSQLDPEGRKTVEDLVEEARGLEEPAED